MMYYNLFKYPRAKFSALGAFGLVSSIGNAFLQDYQNRKNREFQREMLQEQQIFQRELNQHSAGMQKQSLMSAGLSPNLISGAPPYGSASALGDSSLQQAPQIDVGGINAFAHMVQQQPLVEAQARATNASAEAQEIENKRMRSEDAQYSAEEAMDAYNKLSEEDKVKLGLPPVEIVPRNKGWFEAHRNFNQYKGEESDVSLRQFTNAFNQLIVKNQMANPKVLKAVEDMPYAQYESIVQQTNLAIAKASESRANKEYIDANKAYIELKTQLEKDGNIFQYISKIFDGEFDFEDFVKCLVLVGIKVASK